MNSSCPYPILRRILTGSIFALVAMIDQQARAAAFTWIGTTVATPADLNIGLNWSAGIAPAAATPDNFIFNIAGANGAVLNNNITGQVISSAGLNFSSTASAYTFSGNGLTLGTTVDVNFNNSSSNLQTINLPLTMVTDLAVTGASGVTFGGPIGLSGGSATARAIRNDLTSGILTIAGNISLADGAAKTWTFAGTGAGTSFLTGNIANGGAGAGAITVQPTNRLQTVVMSGTNTYTGRTTVSAGTLRLDFSTSAVTDHIINNAANTGALTVGSTLAVTGKAGVTNNQRFASTTFGAFTYRAGAVRITQNGASGVNITLGDLTRNTTGVTVDFTLPTTGTISTTSTTQQIGSNSVFSSSTGVAYGSVDGSTWATNTAGTIGALANGSYQTAFTAANGDTDITASASPTAFTTNTLRFNTASTTLTLNSSGSSTVISGGILVTAAAGGASIASGGGAAGLAVGAGRELVIFNYAPSSGGQPSFTVSAPILDNATSGLTVTGAGVTRLTGTNTYTGTTTVTGGVLDVGTLAGTSNAALGTGGLVLGAGGVLQGNGSFTRAFSGTSTPGLNLLAGADGGFAGKGGNLTLNFGGASAELFLSVGVSRFGGNFIFGSVNSDAAVIVQNPIDLQGLTNGTSRTFTVNPGAGTANDYAELQGVVRDSTGGSSPNFNKSGAGTLILSAANTFVGVTTINAGTLQLGNPSTNGGTTGSVNATSIVNNAVLAFNRSDALSVSGSISGTGAVNQIGAGTATLTATNTYTGITTINPGSTLQLGAGVGGGAAGNISSSVNVVNNGTLVLNRTGSPLFSAPVSGTGSVNVTGAGTIFLVGTSTYTGATTISAGTLQVGNAGTTGSIGGTSGITNNATLSFNRSNLLTVPTNITGSGIVNQIGAGITSLSGANSYAGGTNVNTGTLSYLNTGAKPVTGTTTVLAGATLGLGVATSGTFFTSADVDSLFAGTLAGVTNNVASNVGIDTTAGNFTYSSIIAATTRGLSKLGANTLTLTGVNAYTGITAVAGGVLDVGLISAGALGVGGVVFSNDAVLQGNGTFTRNFSGSATAAAGQIAGTSGGFSAKGATLTVNFGGAGATIAMSTGNSRFGNNLVLGSPTADNRVIVVNPLDLNTVSRTFTVNSGVGGDSAELQGAISGGAFGILKAGGGLLLLSGTSTYTGTTNITTGTLQIGSGGTGGALAAGSAVANNATLAFNRSNAFNFANNITGTGAVNQIGTGTTSLSGANAFAGGSNVNLGGLTFLNTGAKPVIGTTTVLAGATLGLGVATAGNFFTAADVDGLFVGTLAGVTNDAASSVGIDTTAGNFTYATSVSGTARGLSKLGSNTLSLTGINGYTGPTTVSGGILRLDSAGAVPGGILTTGGTSNLVMNGGVLGLTSASGDFTRNPGTGATQVRWITDSVSGFAAFGGDRIVNFGGAGATVTWSNSGGVIGNGLILGDSTSDSTISVVNPIALSNAGSNRPITVNDSAPAVDAVLAGVLSSQTTANNGTRLIKNGAGTLALTAANTYVSGGTFVGTTISAGTLMLGNGGSTGSLSSLSGTGINSDVSVSAGATFAFNRTDSALVVANTITGAGAVRQIGVGTTLLSGTNNYTGATTVTNGTLNVSGSLSGTASVAVSGGATLASGVTGSIGTAVAGNVSITGTLAPGGSTAGAGAGTLNLALGAGGKLSFAVGSTLAFGLGTTPDLIAFNAPGDWLGGSGNATLALDVTLAGFDYANTYTIFQNATTSAFTFSNITGYDNVGYNAVVAPLGNDYIVSFAQVPEPGPLMSVLGGLGLLLGLRRRRRG